MRKSKTTLLSLIAAGALVGGIASLAIGQAYPGRSRARQRVADFCPNPRGGSPAPSDTGEAGSETLRGSADQSGSEPMGVVADEQMAGAAVASGIATFGLRPGGSAGGGSTSGPGGGASWRLPGGTGCEICDDESDDESDDE